MVYRASTVCVHPGRKFLAKKKKKEEEHNQTPLGTLRLLCCPVHAFIHSWVDCRDPIIHSHKTLLLTGAVGTNHHDDW